MGKPVEPADALHHRYHGGVEEASLGEAADVKLDVGSLNAYEGVKSVALAPGEPAAELVGVEGVGVAGLPGQVGHRSELCG